MAEPSRRPPSGRPVSQADRDRARVLGVAGLCGLLIVLIVTLVMIGGSGGGSNGDSSRRTAAAATPRRTPRPTATATATATETAAPKPTPTPTTAAQQEERAAAAQIVVSRGFKVVHLGDYDPKATLRVLIGRSDTGSELAFFFANGDYIGNDSTDPSADVSVVSTDDLEVTLQYGIFQSADEPDKPTGVPVIVHFSWDGTELTPLEALPSPEQRTPGRQ